MLEISNTNTYGDCFLKVKLPFANLSTCLVNHHRHKALHYSLHHHHRYLLLHFIRFCQGHSNGPKAALLLYLSLEVVNQTNFVYLCQEKFDSMAFHTLFCFLFTIKCLNKPIPCAASFLSDRIARHNLS